MGDFDPKPFNEENIREKTWVAWEGEREGGRERERDCSLAISIASHYYELSIFYCFI